MNELEHLLTCLAEECAEVPQRATKALRFGMDEVQTGQKLTNAPRLAGEINDLVAVAEILRDHYDLPDIDRAAVVGKKIRLVRWMEFSGEQGVLVLPEKKKLTQV